MEDGVNGVLSFVVGCDEEDDKDSMEESDNEEQKEDDDEEEMEESDTEAQAAEGGWPRRP